MSKEPMKQSFLFLFILLSTHVCFSQISKGAMLVGGNVSYQSYKGETEMGVSRVRTLDLAPNFGYFFMNRLVIGFRPGLTFRSSDVPSAKLKSNTYTLAPFVRYYFLKNESQINFFADATYGFSKTNYSNPTYFEDFSSNTYAIMAGPCIFLNKSIALEFTFGYKDYNDNSNPSKSTTVSTQLGFQIHFPH